MFSCEICDRARAYTCNTRPVALVWAPRSQRFILASHATLDTAQSLIRVYARRVYMPRFDLRDRMRSFVARLIVVGLFTSRLAFSEAAALFTLVFYFAGSRFLACDTNSRPSSSPDGSPFRFAPLPFEHTVHTSKRQRLIVCHQT